MIMLRMRAESVRLYESGNSLAVNVAAREYGAPCDESGSLKRARTPHLSDVVNLATNADYT